MRAMIPAVLLSLVAPAAVADAPAPTAADTSPRVVGGQAEHEVVVSEQSGVTIYRAGPSAVTTPLPEGYPPPTAPGLIEIKHYPSVRRAEIDGPGARDDGMMGGNSVRAFWPLFNHIKTRNIAMTAPVEMDYPAMSESPTPGDPNWSMSFLYRTPELGPEGADGDIRVYDTEPVTVISLGVRGPIDGGALTDRLAMLREWVERSGAWRVAGDPRSLGYNGPEARRKNRWHEVQLPIEPIESPSAESD